MLYGKQPLADSSRLEIYQFSLEIEDHSQFLYSLWTSPRFPPNPAFSPEKAKGVIENRFLKEYERNGYGHYIVALKANNPQRSADATKNQSTPIGTVCLTKGAPPTAFTAPDIGFGLLPDYMGRGYATEAVGLVISYAERRFGLKDVLGLCDPKNTVSRAVMERAGMVYQGLGDLSAAFGPGTIGCVYVLPHMQGKDIGTWGIAENKAKSDNSDGQ